MRPCASSVVFISTFYPWMTSTDKKIIHHFFHGWHFYPWIKWFYPWMIFSHPWMKWYYPWIKSCHPWMEFSFVMFWEENWKKSIIPRAICIKTLTWKYEKWWMTFSSVDVILGWKVRMEMTNDAYGCSQSVVNECHPWMKKFHPWIWKEPQKISIAILKT